MVIIKLMMLKAKILFKDFTTFYSYIYNYQQFFLILSIFKLVKHKIVQFVNNYFLLLFNQFFFKVSKYKLKNICVINKKHYVLFNVCSFKLSKTSNNVILNKEKEKIKLL